MPATLPDFRLPGRRLQYNLWVAALLLAVFSGAFVVICKLLLSTNGGNAVVCFADAVAIAFLYRHPARDWPLLAGTFFCASALANLTVDLPPGVALLYGVASLAEVLSAALMLRFFLPGGNCFDSLNRWIGFTLFGAFLPSLGSAGIGSAVASLYTGLSYWAIVPAWYLADVAGIMLLLPLVLNCDLKSLRGLGNSVLLARFVAVTTLVVAAAFLVLEVALLPFVFVSLPLIWAATRLPLLQTLAVIFVTVVTLTSYYVGIDGHPNPSLGPMWGEETGARLLLLILASATPAYVMAVYTNIERQRNARIVEMESSFRAAVEKSRIGMLLVSLDGIILRVNRSFCDFLQREEDELVERPLMEITSAEDWALSKDLHRKLCRGESDTVEMESRYLRKGGENVWGHVCCSLARGVDDEPLYAIVQVENINWRKQAAEGAERSTLSKISALFPNAFRQAATAA